MHILKNCISLLTFLMLLQSSVVYANGYHFLHQSAEGFGSAYAANGTAINDISAMFSNPASITRFDGARLSTGVALDFPRSEFTNVAATSYTGARVTGNPASPAQPIDTAFGAATYATYQLNDDVYLGLSLNAPFAYVSEYPETAASRYQATMTELFAYNVNGVVAYKVNKQLSIAASINLQYYDSVLNTQLPTTPDTPSSLTDVGSQIKAGDLGYGFSLGAEYQLNQQTRLGISYRSKINHSFKGDVKFVGEADNLSTLQDALSLSSLSGKANFDISTPSMLQVGVLHKITDKVELYGNANLFGWSAFKDTQIEFNNGFPDVIVDNGWDDSWWLALGAGYQYSEKLKLRTGVAYDWSPTPSNTVSPRAPNDDRMYAALGLSYVMSKKWKFDAGYLFILFEEAEVRLAGGNNAPRGDLSGDLNLYANVFMFQINRTL